MNSFPKIFAIGTKYILDIFNEDVEITEKIDGSQFVFGKLDGEFFVRSKGAQLYFDNPEKMFSLAIKYIEEIKDRLPEDTIFYSEYLKSPKHNILKYDRTPKNNLILFGASTKDKSFLPDWRKYADIFEIEAVPIIFNGKIDNSEQILGLLKNKSVLGDVGIEGVVVKNYSRSFLIGGQVIPLMSGKYVSEAFKEVHKEEWQTGKDRWQLFLQSFRTDARWHKAIQHLLEKSELENSPRDIGKLMKEIGRDIESEEKEEIKNWLWNEKRREIISCASSGFPEFYKKYLLEKGFIK